MALSRNLSVADAIHARVLIEAGISQSAVSMQRVVHHATLNRVNRRFQQTESNSRREVKATLGVLVTSMTVF